MLAYEPERVVLSAQVASPAWLVLADAWYPGWQARVDGQAVAVRRANLMFRAVPLAAGEHEVVFRYDPPSWRRGVAISLVTLCCIISLAISSLAWRPKRERL